MISRQNQPSIMPHRCICAHKCAILDHLRQESYIIKRGIFVLARTFQQDGNIAAMEMRENQRKRLVSIIGLVSVCCTFQKFVIFLRFGSRVTLIRF